GSGSSTTTATATTTLRTTTAEAPIEARWGPQPARKSRRVWCQGMTEARLAARPTAVRSTPASVRVQADSAIPAGPEALLRRPRHRRRALRQRPAALQVDPAVTGTVGKCRQEDTSNRTKGQVDKRKGGREANVFCPPFRLSTCPLVYLFTA